MAALTPDCPRIGAGCEITGSHLGRYVSVGAGSRILNSRIGDYSYTDRSADIANAQVAKFSNIASFARIGPTDHPLDRASLHHFMYRSADYWDDVDHDSDFFAQRAARQTRIGNDTWIGHNAIIRPGLDIGDGAVVAAGAVVTRNVAPYTIVAGVPANPIRQRQPRDVADRLIALAWWDWSHDRLRETLQDFRTLGAVAFLEKYEKPHGVCTSAFG